MRPWRAVPRVCGVGDRVDEGDGRNGGMWDWRTLMDPVCEELVLVGDEEVGSSGLEGEDEAWIGM